MDRGRLSQQVAVIGAGFSGLTAAYYLRKAGFSIEIFERTNRTGGLIQTRQTPNGISESAANGLLNCEELEELCSDLGVELIATRKEARRRYVFRNSKPRQWPLTLKESLRIAWFLLRFLLVRKTVAPRSSESLAEWGARVMGASASRFSIEAAVLGIYATEAKNLSAPLVLKRLFEKRPSRAKSAGLRLGGGTVAPRLGMEELTRKITERLLEQGVKLNINSEVLSCSELESKFDFVVVATSAESAAEFLKNSGDQRAALLDQITLLPMTSTTVFTKALERPKVEGFGILFPTAERRQALGVLLNNFIFEDRAIHCQSETWITSGAELRDQLLIDSVLSERAQVLRQKVDLIDYQIHRWPKALPAYDLQLEKVLESLPLISGKIVLMGNYLGEIGLRQLLLRAKALPELLKRKQ